jgi:hypothetical protein
MGSGVFLLGPWRYKRTIEKSVSGEGDVVCLFPITCYMCYTYTWQKPSIFIRDKPILSSERMLLMDYDRKGSVKQKGKCLVVSLKGLGAKMNWLAVIRQSPSSSDSESISELVKIRLMSQWDRELLRFRRCELLLLEAGNWGQEQDGNK